MTTIQVLFTSMNDDAGINFTGKEDKSGSLLMKKATALQWCEVSNVINLPSGGKLLSLGNAAILGLPVGRGHLAVEVARASLLRKMYVAAPTNDAHLAREVAIFHGSIEQAPR